MLDAHGQAAEAFKEGREVLAAQQGCRSDDRGLLAGQGGDEGGAQGDFGLAVADIAAHQAVHGRGAGEVGEAVVDGARLVLGLGERKTRGEGLVESFFGGEAGGAAGGALGRGADQAVRHVEQAALEARLARLPAGAAEAVERGCRVFAAVAREHFDVLDRQVELVVAGVENDQTVMRGAPRVDGLKPCIAADSVVDMHREIAFRQGAGLGEEIRRPAPPRRRARQPIAENVLFAQQRQAVADEAMLQRQHHCGDGARRQRSTAAQSSVSFTGAVPWSASRPARRAREPAL